MSGHFGSDETGGYVGYVGYDQLDPADSLLGELDSDPLDTGYLLPDEQPHTRHWRLTEADEQRGESLAEHLAEEEPDVGGHIRRHENERWDVPAETAAMHVITDEPDLGPHSRHNHVVEVDLAFALAVPVRCPGCQAALSTVRGVEAAQFHCHGCGRTWRMTLGYLEPMPGSRDPSCA